METLSFFIANCKVLKTHFYMEKFTFKTFYWKAAQDLVRVNGKWPAKKLW